MKAKPWIVDTRRDSCDCSQHVDLTQTGFGAEQGCVKFCPVCHIGFWEILIQPTPLQVIEAQKVDRMAGIASMQYTVLKREPKNKWGSTSESIMTDQFGKSPWWLSEQSRVYWLKKYIEKYPNSLIAKSHKKAD